MTDVIYKQILLGLSFLVFGILVFGVNTAFARHVSVSVNCSSSGLNATCNVSPSPSSYGCPSDLSYIDITWGDGSPRESVGSDFRASHTYNSAGTYSVGVTAAAYDETSSCGPDLHSASAGDSVTVSEPNKDPVADFSWSEGAQWREVNFNNQSYDPDGDDSIAASKWQFGDGDTGWNTNPGHWYDSEGTYSVTLTVWDDSCGDPCWDNEDSTSGSVTVTEPAPSVSASLSASPSTICDGESSTLTWDSDGANSCSGSGFSTGGSTSGSTSASPSSDTSYSVTCSNSENSDSDSASITVDSCSSGGGGGDGGDSNSSPSASFTIDATDLTVDVDASGSSDSDGSISSYDWNYGDGATGSGVIDTHTYSSDGEKTITLTVTDNDGASDTRTKTPTLSSGSSNQDPVADIAFNNIRLDAGRVLVDFDGTGSHDPDGGSITEYDYRAGDGGGWRDDKGSVYTYPYADFGTYDVDLSVRDDEGDYDQTTKTLVIEEPVADFDYSTNGLTVDFDAGSSYDPDSGGSIEEYEWVFGDGEVCPDNPDNDPNCSHTYSSGGTYNVELTITNDHGFRDQIRKDVTVNEPNSSPTASFSYTVDNLDASFNASNSSDPDGSIADYSWDFDDGNTGNGETVDHTYDSEGTYTVELTVTDNDGATDTHSETINPEEGRKIQGFDRIEI